MNTQIERIKKVTEPLRQQIINHKVYAAIQTVDDLKIFMEYHVYAVWDFMSLLKALQNNLTCTSIPWFPKGDAETRHLINEIVVGEEADVDINGERKSHFELYLEAMQQCGATTTQMHQFIHTLKSTNSFDAAYSVANTPQAAKEFVNFTFDVINTNAVHLQAAIFTFGREDLIPNMFIAMVNDIHKTFPNSVSIFKYYLERHIEIDGDHHSNLALQMTANLCGSNKEYWQEAETATIQSLQKRIALWDGVYDQLIKNKGANTVNNFA